VSTKKSKPQFSEGDLVYFTAFLKKDKDTFYLCRGHITECPPNNKQPYKVKIKSVGCRPVGGDDCLDQASLLGRTISKKTNELTKQPLEAMVPPGWIEVVVN
jgi:hypothetical protein